MILVIADCAAGPFVAFPISFTVPVAFTAWTIGRMQAFLLALLLPTIRFTYVWYLNIEQFSPVINFTNLLIRIAVLAFIAQLVSIIVGQNQLLKHRIKMLEGILPICSFCKRIRLETDEWQQLEQYISEATNAQFSHGLCESCFREHYPQVPLKENKN